MTLYSKLTILMLSFCLYQCNFVFSCYGSDGEEQTDTAKVTKTTGKSDTSNEPKLSDLCSIFWRRNISDGGYTEVRLKGIDSRIKDKIEKWMRDGEYEKVVTCLENELARESKTFDLLWKDGTVWHRGVGWGIYLSGISGALERGGYLRESRNIKEFFARGNTFPDAVIWQKARDEYSRGNYEAAFEQVYNAVRENYVFWNLDAVLARHNDKTEHPNRSREYMLSNIEFKKIHELKDECLLVIWPDFHWHNYYPHYTPYFDVKKIDAVREQYKQSLQEFMQFIEDEYSRRISQECPENNSKYNEMKYGPMVEQFRKLLGFFLERGV